MRKTKSQKGITLIALIITIIVLLILAVVAIGAVQNDGIIDHAKNARDEYGAAGVTENSTIQSYLDKIQEHVGTGIGSTNGNNNIETESTAPLVDQQGNDAKNTVLSITGNTTVVDEYGNEIVVPAGFKITTDANHVTEGIVIEDCTDAATKGSQFVWIPVGDVYTTTDTEKTAENTKTITLGRYEFDSTGEASAYSGSVTEDTADNHNSEKYGNAIAKDLKGFIDSATTKGGYYLARYEAGVTNYDSSKIVTSNSKEETNWTGYVAEEGKALQLVSKRDVQVWDYVTQNKASELSRNMYVSNNFTSDLVNSYAWDTAIIFIQTFGGCEDYANKNFSTRFANTGINTDKYCNIHDMSGNAFEWSTESGSTTSSPCIYRGGYFTTSDAGSYKSHNTKYRSSCRVSYGYKRYSFRPLLYVAL